MPNFDPATIRKAVAEFTPARPERFQDLIPAKEVVRELRQKRASYRAIAELLTQHCLPASKTAIAAFCHEVLGEIIRPKRRPNRKRLGAGNGESGHVTYGNHLHSSVEPPKTPDSALVQARGPRIAKVRMLPPKSE